MRAGVFLVAVLSAALAAPTAVADRPATAEEQAAVAAAWGYPSDCVTVEVSTVDDAWARAAAGCVGQSQADAVGLLQLTDAGWEERATGTPAKWFDCVSLSAPRRVTADLALCPPARVYIPCWPGTKVLTVPRVRPQRCDTSSSAPTASAVNLRRLAWRRWGKREAFARGVNIGYGIKPIKLPVRVRAYRLRVGCNGYVYTRLSVRSRHGRTVIKFPTSC